MGARENFIGGAWVGSSMAKPNINPSNVSDVIGDYVRADEKQANDAIDAAAQAAAGWADSTPQVRFDALDKIGTEILARKQELRRIARRVKKAKRLPEGIGEATRAGHIFKFFAGEALRIEGEKMASVRPGFDVEITREPVGVVGIIAPWNFPIAIPAWKVAPALAYRQLCRVQARRSRARLLMGVGGNH